MSRHSLAREGRISVAIELTKTGSPVSMIEQGVRRPAPMACKTVLMTGSIELSSSSMHYVLHCLSYCSLTLFVGTVHGHFTHEFSKQKKIQQKNDPSDLGCHSVSSIESYA